jgi:hypothetical protein
MARNNSSTPTNNAASAVKKKTSSKRTTALDSSAASQGGEWVLAPAVVLTLFGAVMLVASISGAFSFTFIEPLVALLLIALGLLCTWRIAKREMVRKFVRVIAWILAIVVALATVYWFGGANDNTCTGLMGVQTSCMDVNRLMITVLLLNPFSLALWAVLAGSGVIGLLIKPAKS